MEVDEGSQEESANKDNDFTNLDRELLGDSPAQPKQESPPKKDLGKMLFGRLGME